jgi:hypothetical protein
MHREAMARRATTLAVLLAAAVGACLTSARPSAATPTPASQGRPTAAPETRPSTWATHTPRQATPTAAGAAAREPLSQGDVQRLLERAWKGSIAGRELTEADRARLSAAVVRLEEAAQTLRATDRSTATEDEIEERRAGLVSALGEIEEITGLPPAELGALLGSDAGAPGDAAP